MTKAQANSLWLLPRISRGWQLERDTAIRKECLGSWHINHYQGWHCTQEAGAWLPEKHKIRSTLAAHKNLEGPRGAGKTATHFESASTKKRPISNSRFGAIWQHTFRKKLCNKNLTFSFESQYLNSQDGVFCDQRQILVDIYDWAHRILIRMSRG